MKANGSGFVSNETTIIDGNVGIDFFAGLLDNRPLKFAGVAFASFATIFVVAATYGIIWFERFGSDLKRIFVNKMVSCISWSIIAWFAVIQIPDMILYFFRPFPEFLCEVHLVLRNVVVSHILLYFDSIAIYRYVMIFCLKNPIGFQDDFWCQFVVSWIAIFSSVSQFVFVFLPGRQPLNFYICSNTLKVSMVNNSSFKLNWQLTVLQIFSFFLHAAVNVKIKLYKRQQQTSVIVITQSDLAKDVEINSIDNRALSDFLTNVFGVAVTSSFGITTTLVNRTSPADFNEFPGFLLVYFMHFVVPFLITGTIAVLYYIRNPALRKTLYRELKPYFNRNA